MVAWTDTAKDAYNVIIWPSPQFRKKRHPLYIACLQKLEAMFFYNFFVLMFKICVKYNQYQNNVESFDGEEHQFLIFLFLISPTFLLKFSAFFSSFFHSSFPPFSFAFIFLFFNFLSFLLLFLPTKFGPCPQAPLAELRTLS